MPDLLIDEARRNAGDTGILIRAKNAQGGWETVDISALDKASLLVWLKSRGGDNRRAEDAVGILLGHGHLHQVGG